MLSDKAVEAIQESKKTDIIIVDGQEYVSHPVFKPPEEKLPAPLVVHTLESFTTYLRENRDGFAADDCLVHVESPMSIKLLNAPFGRENTRTLWCHAMALRGGGFSFNNYIDLETFLIEIQSQFVQDEVTKRILQVIGNISDQQVKTSLDDGVSQEITIRAGIARQGTATLTNPVTLRPFRTFAEIEQPPSLYILRLRSMKDALPTVALFEVMDNRWQLEAIKALKAYLAQTITAMPILG